MTTPCNELPRYTGDLYAGTRAKVVFEYLGRSPLPRPVPDQLGPPRNSIGAVPKQVRQCLHSTRATWLLSAVIVRESPSMVQIKLPGSDPISGPELISSEALTMVPNLLRRLTECRALPFVSPRPFLKTIQENPQGTGQHFFVIPEGLLFKRRLDEPIWRRIRDCPRKPVKLWVSLEDEAVFMQFLAKRLPVGRRPICQLRDESAAPPVHAIGPLNQRDSLRESPCDPQRSSGDDAVATQRPNIGRQNWRSVTQSWCLKPAEARSHGNARR